jgi:hypothetical protein
MGEKDEKPIRVVDRRMFTADGELRPDFEPEEPGPTAPAAPPPAAKVSSAPARAAAAGPGGPPRATPPASASGHQPAPGSPNATENSAPPGREDDELGGEADGAATDERASDPHSDFTAIVKSLATTAYSALGLLPDPAGGRHREPAVARQMIDWLSVLESKTRNNLSFEESEFLSRVLYVLRMAFVEVVGPPGPAGAGRPRPPGR